MELSLSELAEQLGLVLQGEDRPVTGVNTLEAAGPQEVTFLANPRYDHLLEETNAAAVILDREHAGRAAAADLISENPYLDFARAVALFAKPQGSFTGVSGQSFVHPEAELGQGATVYPFVYVGPGAVIGAGTTLFSGVYVGEGSTIGEECVLYPNVTVMAGTSIGQRVIIHAGSVLGSDGFGFVMGEQGREKIPQIGTVVVEDEVEIGAGTTIDRAALGETRIGRGTKIDNLVQIGHNVHIGQGSVIVAQVGIAGSTTVGRNVVLAGQVGVAGHLTIGDNCRVGAKSGVAKSLDAGKDYGGIPAIEQMRFLRYVSVAPRLPDMLRQLKDLEKEVARLRDQLQKGGTTA